jgi:peptidoglycan/LPS O-acetylase OafA/YrhL
MCPHRQWFNLPAHRRRARSRTIKQVAEMTNDRVAGFDGIRALAVIAVVLTHYGAYASMTDSALLPMVHGTTGVRAFFVLSGFLITGLLLREYRDSGGINYLDFLARRALRIVPLYFLFLSLVTLLFFFGYWQTNPKGLPYAWLYAYNFVPPALYAPLLAHTWSLAVEEHFYLLWPIALMLLLPRRRALVGFTVVCALLSAAAYFVFTRWLDLKGYFFDRWTPVAAFSLLVGCLAALLVNFERTGDRIAAACQSRSYVAIGMMLFLTPTLIYFVPLLAHRVAPAHLALNLQSAGIAMLLVWLVFNQRSTVVAGLEMAPLKYIGKISYGIYIWQGFFLAVSPDRVPGSSWPPDPMIGVLGVAVLAPLSYHLYEARFLQMKYRFRATPQFAV